MKESALETVLKYYRVDRREICFLRFIVEAYDGMAFLRTIDPEKGIVALHISPGCEADVEYLFDDIKKNMMIEPFQQDNV